MKKVLGLSLALTMVMTMGMAFAQTDSHDVTIRIPNLVQLRVTDGVSNAEATNPSVEFDYQANPVGYINAVNGGTNLAPTAVTDFGDVVVFANRGGWNVSVQATAMAFNDNLGLGVAGAGLDLADVVVTPSGAAGTGVSSVNANWALSTTSAQIASGVKTSGWSSLGFDGNDYELVVNGDEDPGEYTTTVTYTITAP